ncbi:MAG: ATP-binding cassette domain-containing protein, partial [Pseudomonadota bacterium]
MDKHVLLSLQGITKAYPGCLANDQIDLELHKGDIHALLGENGAGKSTLVKIIYGVLAPDYGKMLWKGQDIRIPNPTMARQLGINMVFQHFSLFEAMSVEDNIALSMPTDVNRTELTTRISHISRQYGLHLNPERFVYDLSMGERQRVEIVRCLLQSPQLLIMDEPTSVLTPQEAESLFATLHNLAEEGCAILYISHRLREIRDLCTKATIMRAGRVIEKCNPQTTSTRQLAALMMGEEVGETKRAAQKKSKALRLRADNIVLPNLMQNTPTPNSPEPSSDKAFDFAVLQN